MARRSTALAPPPSGREPTPTTERAASRSRGKSGRRVGAPDTEGRRGSSPPGRRTYRWEISRGTTGGEAVRTAVPHKDAVTAAARSGHARREDSEIPARTDTLVLVMEWRGSDPTLAAVVVRLYRPGP